MCATCSHFLSSNLFKLDVWLHYGIARESARAAGDGLKQAVFNIGHHDEMTSLIPHI
jgi:hypothetical protein